MTYIGGKNGSGVFQAIINQIPPHDIYIELFLGSGAIMRKKLPADVNIGVDLDPEATKIFQEELVKDRDSELWKRKELRLYNEDALAILREINRRNEKRIFLYLDPPYPFSTRNDPTPVYNYEFGEDEQHIELLTHVITLPRNWMIAISSYPNPLYENILGPHWRSLEFQARTRQGMATEVLWMNYPEPNELHDYRYLGSDYREREKIKKQQRRWRKKLAGMDRLQRLAMMSVLAEKDV